MNGMWWEVDYGSSLPCGVQVNGVYSEWRHEVKAAEWVTRCCAPGRT